MTTPLAQKKDIASKLPKLQFILTGFTQDAGFRVFAFERIGDGRIRTKFSVRAELALARAHGIPIQELALLCRRILERREVFQEEEGELRSLTFTEEEMLAYSRFHAATLEAAKKRRTSHRPTGENLGAAWRSQPS